MERPRFSWALSVRRKVLTAVWWVGCQLAKAAMLPLNWRKSHVFITVLTCRPDPECGARIVYVRCVRVKAFASLVNALWYGYLHRTAPKRCVQRNASMQRAGAARVRSSAINRLRCDPCASRPCRAASAPSSGARATSATCSKRIASDPPAPVHFAMRTRTERPLCRDPSPSP